MVGSTCRYRHDGYPDLLSLAQPRQDFDIPADCAPESNGPPVDGAIRQHADQVQLPHALHRLTRDDQNLLFVEWNQNSPEHSAVHALRARSSDLHLKGSAAGFRFRHDLVDRAQTLLVETLDLHFDRLADIQPLRERLTDARDELHLQGVKERRQYLSRRHHVADRDSLVDHNASNRRPDRGPFERGLNLIDRLLGAAQPRVGSLECGYGPVVFLSADGPGLEQISR